MSKSNSKRFVSAAWSLLFFQVIASAGAVAVTGYAALYVQNLPAVQTAVAPATDVGAMTPATAVDATPAPADQPAPPPDASAATTTPAPATAVAAPPASPIAACARNQRFWRVTADWCDTGVGVKGGQPILFLHGGGAPLTALSGRVGEATFRIVEGRATSPADGSVLLQMSPEADGDHQGYVDAYVAPH